MQLYPLKAIYPNLELIASTDTFFSTVKHQFSDLYKNGFYKQNQDNSLYIYEISKGNDAYVGLLGCIDIDEYINGNVKIHEETLAHKEQKSMNRLLERKAMIKPILLSHPPSKDLHEIISTYQKSNKPLLEVEFKETETHHSVWQIDEIDIIEKLRSVFHDQMNTVYIADGHHRSAVSKHLYEKTKNQSDGLKFDKLYSAFFAFDQLRVNEFNRIISILDTVSPSKIIARLSTLCDISPIDEFTKPDKPLEMTMLIRDDCFKLEWKKHILKDYEKKHTLLDPALFNDLICNNIFGIEDVRSDSRISYIKGSEGIKGVLRKTDYKNDVAFTLYPLNFDQFKQCSDQGILLPPKSTYFQPRMKNGILAQTF